MKTKTMALSMTAVLATLGSAQALATSTGPANPYGVQPHEVRVLNKEPSASDIANICANQAKYRGLSGAEMDGFINKCKSDI